MSFELEPAFSTLLFSLSVGICLLLFSNKIKFPPIAFLLLSGILLGPQGLGVVHPDSLGHTLEALLSVGIAIILFEGGLTLDHTGYRKASRVIISLLTIGVLVTLFVNALALQYFFQFSFLFSLLASSLIVVTGPTVVLPLLRRLNVTKRVYHILHWEGVLIDPIGVFLAVLCFELVLDGGADAAFAVANLMKKFVVGFGGGLFFGYLSLFFLNKNRIPKERTNSFTLMVAVLTFGVCDYLSEESGLLGVVVAGLIIGINKTVVLEDIKKFKLEVTEIFIGALFILLSAKLELESFAQFGWNGVFALLVVLFVARPVSVFLSSQSWFRKSKIAPLSFREKIFIAWVAPRGVIAATMAALFSTRLQAGQVEQSALWFLEVFTFSVIAVTVLLQGFTAPHLARWLKLTLSHSKDWVLVGAHEFSAHLATLLRKKGYNITIIDNNLSQVQLFQERGVNAIHQDSLAYELYEKEIFVNTARLVALTDNAELNALICEHWKNLVPAGGLYRWGNLAKDASGGQVVAGSAIWENLPKPTMISEALRNAEGEFFEETVSSKAVEENWIPLWRWEAGEAPPSFFQSRLQLKQPKREEGRSFSKLPVLFFSRSKVSFKTLLKRNQVFLYSPQESSKKPLSAGRFKAEFYKLLLAKVKQTNPHLNLEALAQEIQLRENNSALALGNGVALAHLSSNKISRPLLVVGVAPAGLDLKAYDGKKIKAFFLLLSVASDQVRSLSIISTLSRLVSQASYREQLFTAASPDQLLKQLNNTKPAE